jgi:hypothetical protein
MKKPFSRRRHGGDFWPMADVPSAAKQFTCPHGRLFGPEIVIDPKAAHR